FIYCLSIGARITADCVSVEKRDGTLGLLFLTDLRGFDVALGKLAATSLSAIYGLLASVPILAIPLLLGGVGGAEFWRATLVLLNTLVFSLSAGLLVSALSRDERKAAGGAVLLLLGIGIGLPILGMIHLSYRRASPGAVLTNGMMPTAPLAYLLPSPGFACLLASDQFYRGLRGAFWGSVAITHGLSWLCLAAVSLILPHVWQDRPATAGVWRWRERLRSGRDPQRHALTRARVLDRNPVYWLAIRHWWRTADIWLIFAIFTGGWCLGWYRLGRDWLNLAIATGTAVTFQLLLKHWMAGIASSPLVEELRTGTLELLLSTPLSIDDILRGRLLALRRQVTGPAIAVLGLAIALWWAAPDWREFTHRETINAIAGFAAAVLMLGADLFTLAWVGLWMAISSANARKAAGGAVLRVLILPWLILGAIGAAWSFLSWKSHWTYSPGFGLGLGLWLGVGLLVDLFFWRWSRNRLRAELRVRATLRYAPDATASVWYQLGKRWARWRLRTERIRRGAG
ncbi:MAG: ABC transporter permease, partial [Verrucomicrobia bacterium]|nr:ABC transporter permease [Verrucomicrobiota bacterium]